MEGGGASEEEARKLLRPLREVRKSRQGPAHAIRRNITDRTFIHRQIALLRDITEAIGALRHWLATHADCNEWQDKRKDLKTYMLWRLRNSRSARARNSGPCRPGVYSN